MCNSVRYKCGHTKPAVHLKVSKSVCYKLNLTVFHRKPQSHIGVSLAKEIKNVIRPRSVITDANEQCGCPYESYLPKPSL